MGLLSPRNNSYITQGNKLGVSRVRLPPAGQRPQQKDVPGNKLGARCPRWPPAGQKPNDTTEFVYQVFEWLYIYIYCIHIL